MIIEKKLGIPPDYQEKALNGSNFIQSNWHANKLYVVNKLINITGKERVLDLGTGSGNFELAFANHVAEIVGIDYNSDAVKYLQEKLRNHNISNVKLINEDIRNLENVLDRSNKFDLIVILDVIEHLDYKDANILVHTLNNYLNKNGLVLVITPNYKSPWPLIECFLDTFKIVPTLASMQHLTKFDRENLTSLFKKHRFRTITLKTFNLFSFVFPLASKRLCKLELVSSINLGNLIVGVFGMKKTKVS